MDLSALRDVLNANLPARGASLGADGDDGAIELALGALLDDYRGASM
jgi:hypothetical protein